MAYCQRVALHHVVRDRVAACNDPRPSKIVVTNIAVMHMAAARGAGGVELDMATAVAGSSTRRGMQGMKASAVETAAMKTARVKAAARMKATTASVKATAAAMEAATTAVEATAPTASAAGSLCRV